MDLNLDSLELMNLIGMSPRELDIPSRFARFQEVVGYFNQFKNPRSKILNLVFKHPSADKLETLWGYVKLEKEKRDIIHSLDPDEFDAAIKSELERGLLTLDKQKRIRDDIARREVEEKDKEKFTVRVEDIKYEKKRDEKLQEANRYQPVKEKLNQLELVNQALESYT